MRVSQVSTRIRMKLLLPLGWDRANSDQEHNGSGKGSWVAGTEGSREPLWGKEEVVRLSNRKGMESSLQALPQLLTPSYSW